MGKKDRCAVFGLACSRLRDGGGTGWWWKVVSLAQAMFGCNNDTLVITFFSRNVQ